MQTAADPAVADLYQCGSPARRHGNTFTDGFTDRDSAADSVAQPRAAAHDTNPLSVTYGGTDSTPTPQPTPQPTPELSTIKVRIQDDAFVGDFNGAGSGDYHGRTATWIYGQGTPYHTMTAQFELDQAGDAVRRATLRIIGLEGSEPPSSEIAIVLNGTTIYEGRDPLPNDFAPGPTGPGNWGSETFEFSADLLQRNNELVDHKPNGDRLHDVFRLRAG